VAVKFLIRDERQRAQREWSALTLLEHLRVPLGPRPLYCDLARMPHAVVVQTWLEGEVLQAPPTDDATWLQILQMYATLHQVQPADVQRYGIELPQMGSVWPADQAGTALRAFAGQVPPTRYADALSYLLQTVDQLRLPPVRSTWCWCHGDPNIRNLLRTSGGVQAVDWEYNGLSDPAEEIARLMTHPFAHEAGDFRWHWVAEQYAQVSGEADMRQRIPVQYAVRLAWWCIRLLVGHYVLLRQPSHRLVGPGAEAEISTLEIIDQYFARAHRWLALFT
jgi:thiamine kinase-like enzyme